MPKIRFKGKISLAMGEGQIGPCTPKNCILYIAENSGILVLGICILYVNLQSEYFGILLSLKL